MLWLNVEASFRNDFKWWNNGGGEKLVTKSENLLLSSRWCYWISFADLIILFPIKTMALDCIKTVARVSLAGRGVGGQFTLHWKILDCSFYFCHL